MSDERQEFERALLAAFDGCKSGSFLGADDVRLLGVPPRFSAGIVRAGRELSRTSTAEHEAKAKEMAAELAGEVFDHLDALDALTPAEILKKTPRI